MLDEKALSSAMEAYSPQTQGQPDRARLARAIAAYLESAKPKESEGLTALAAACPTILKAGEKLEADRVSGKVVVGCYGDVPAVEFKRLAAMLSAAGDGR
jgi:Asp/Glu/hydantoin racemase